MKDFQMRVVEERTDLCCALSRLKIFLESDTFKSLPTDEKAIFYKQRDVMEQYAGILRDRISKF